MKKRLPEIILGILIILYIGFFSYLSIMRYTSYYASYYDMGIMNQTVYNTFQGRFLELTDPEGLANIKRMTIHSDLFLALLAPFYMIYTGSETLLIIQAIIIALGAWGLYLLGLKKLHSKWLALTISFAYLMFVPLQRANLFDFHAVSVVPTFLIFMFYFGETKKYFWSFVFAFLAMLTKEQVALTTAVYGIYILISKREDRKFGLSMLVGSLLWVVLIVFVVIPFFGKNASHFAMYRYSHLGSSAIDIVKNVLFHPFATLSLVFDGDTFRYFWFMYGPTLFLSFLAPWIAFIPIFDFAINLLSNDPNMKNIIFQYTSVITPFVFISAIYGLNIIIHKFKNFAGIFLAFLILASTLLFSIFKGPLPYSYEADLYPILYPAQNIPEMNLWEEKLKDENIVVSATPRVATHFSSRKTIFIFDERYGRSDYIVIARSEIEQKIYPYDAKIDSIYKTLQKDERFEKIYAIGNLEVYKRIK